MSQMKRIQPVNYNLRILLFMMHLTNLRMYSGVRPSSRLLCCMVATELDNDTLPLTLTVSFTVLIKIYRDFYSLYVVSRCRNAKWVNLLNLLNCLQSKIA